MSSSKGSATSAVPVAPPTPQEITRKLSVHNKPIKHSSHHSSQVSGPESDSDSILTPDISPLATHSATFAIAGSSTQKPLSSIAERSGGSGDGEESDEDEEDEGWRSSTAEKGHRAGEDTVLKTGYLWKKGERRKTWKKRWFVLRPAHLAFYKDSAEYKLSRLLELSEVHSCTPVTLKRHANAFGLVSPTRTYYLQAETPEEVHAWVAALNEAREQLMNTSTQTSSTTAPIPIPTTPTRSRSGANAPSSPATQRSQVPSHNLSTSPQSQNAHITSESESDDPYSLPEGQVFSPSHLAAMSPPKASTLPPKDPTKAVLSGYLMKCRSKRRQWRKRWFVLTGEKLMYTASHMDTKRQRSVDLSEILDALEYDLPTARNYGGSASASSVGSPPLASPSAPKSMGEDNSHEAGAHVFKIVMTKRSLLLCAPSEEEEIKWLSAVRALIARRSVNPQPTAQPTLSVGGNTVSQTKEIQPHQSHARRTSLSLTGRQRSTSTSQSIQQPVISV